MTTNPFFNHFDYTEEQRLIDSLVIESTQMHGQDMMYVPIRKGSLDGIFYEDDTSYYDTYYTMEIYVKSYTGFEGQQTFMSTIGLEIRDQVVFSVARTRFKEEVTIVEPDTTRPYEGDLIYFPLNKKLFKVMFVDDKPFFYQAGALQMYDVTCELFEYSGEILNTGISEIDRLQKEYSLSVFDYELRTEANDRVVTEDENTVIVLENYNYLEDNDPLQDNDRIKEEEASNSVFTWDENNPFSLNDETEEPW